MSQKQRKEIFLHPGEWFFGGAETVVSTLLGSCVAIILWHPELKIGGMCHYLLASRGKHPGRGLSGRYGDEAMLLLLQQVLASERELREFRVKLIGAATTLLPQEGERSSNDVATRNAAMARLLARQLGLLVQVEELGGNKPRMVVFDVQTGDVWVRLIQDNMLSETQANKSGNKT